MVPHLQADWEVPAPRESVNDSYFNLELRKAIPGG